MAAFGPLHRALVLGIMLGSLACAAPSSAARFQLPAGPAVLDMTPLLGQRPGGSRTLLQLVYRDRFCRWYRQHRLCQLAASPSFCERKPDHRLCADEDQVSVCSQNPNHPACDDGERFCKKRPDHPLCNDGQPPSPS